MIKLIVAVKRIEGMSPQDFQNYWKNDHAKHVNSISASKKYIRKYSQFHTLLASYQREEPAFDGTAELWFDSLQD